MPTKKRRTSSQHLKWTAKGEPMPPSPSLAASPVDEETALVPAATLAPAAMVAPAAALPPRAPASAYAEDTVKVRVAAIGMTGCNHRHGGLRP